MKKTESKHKNARQPNGDCGMTLEEIKMRLLVNSMKIKIEQQKLLPPFFRAPPRWKTPS